MNAILVEDGVDTGLAWHHGNPVAEAHAIEAGDAMVDLSNRDILEVTRADRLGWLHSLTLQHLESLGAEESFETLVFLPNGRVEHVLAGVDDGTRALTWTEPGRAAALVDLPTSMRFTMRVKVCPRDDLRLTWVGDDVEASGNWTRRPALGGREVLRPVDAALSRGRPAEIWASDAHRIASGVPRVFVNIDVYIIPSEIGLFDIHLDKGCYRGQEMVARVHNLGRSLRRLMLLHLDGTTEAPPAAGSTLEVGGRTVGFAGSSVRYHGLGPIALALVKRAVPTDATLTVDGIAATQKTLVDLEVSLHFRANLC